MALPPSLLCVLVLASVLSAGRIFVFPLFRLHLAELNKSKKKRKREETHDW